MLGNVFHSGTVGEPAARSSLVGVRDTKVIDSWESRPAEPRPQGSGASGILLRRAPARPRRLAARIPMCSMKRAGPWYWRPSRGMARTAAGTPAEPRPRGSGASGVCPVQPRARRCGSRGSTRENHERVQIVRQPRTKPVGKRRTRSKALGTPWKQPLRSRASPWRRSPWKGFEPTHGPLSCGRGSATNVSPTLSALSAQPTLGRPC
jgi:hypothetical protein